MRLSSTNNAILALSKEKVNTFSENIFNEVKRRVTVPDAFRRYVGGERIRRGGMVHCPFHDDKNPSMQLNGDFYYCHGCHAHGDVIDLVAHLYNLNPWNAVRKLNYDFNLGLPVDGGRPPTAAERLEMERQRQEAEELARFRRWRSDTLDKLASAWRVSRELYLADRRTLSEKQRAAAAAFLAVDCLQSCLEGNDVEKQRAYWNDQAFVVSVLLTVGEAVDYD